MEVLAALNKWQRRQFNYGDADCCQFTAFIVNELTGHDYTADFIYQSEQEADNIINKFKGLKALIVSILGEPSQQLKDGDPCLVNIPLSGELMGVKLGSSIVALTQRGMIRIHERYLVCGWSV
jgi:hypothetical protein